MRGTCKGEKYGNLLVFTVTGKASDVFTITSHKEENTGETENCEGVFKDAARAISWQYEGIQALINTKAPNAQMQMQKIYHLDSIL